MLSGNIKELELTTNSYLFSGLVYWATPNQMFNSYYFKITSENHNSLNLFFV